MSEGTTGAPPMEPVLAAMRSERAALVDLLGAAAPEDWHRPTECPRYSVKGIATHVLGDDLSLLSRQRDGAPNGLLLLADEMAGADFRTLLDTFNDRFVAAAAFLSPRLLVLLLRLAGDWTAAYYEEVDPDAPGEPVLFFGAGAGGSPMWQAVSREYLERWIHHSQILRALGRASLSDEPFLRTGIRVVAHATGLDARFADGGWWLGEVRLGPPDQAAAILTRAHTAAEIVALVTGPSGAIGRLAAAAAR